MREQEQGEVPHGGIFRHRQEQLACAAIEFPHHKILVAAIRFLSAEEDDKRAGLKSVIKGTFTPLSAYAFITFVLLYMPCVIAAVAMVLVLAGVDWKWVVASFGGLAVNAGVDIYQVKDLLGHSSVTVTQNVYAHLLQGTLRTASEIVGQTLDSARGSLFRVAEYPETSAASCMAA